MNNKPQQQQQQQQHNHNNNNIFDLTLRLSQALDQNYDVVHMDAVISVISALEGTTITKEQLEATRLAKFINQLRRRTKSEQLARRAKSLLKKWREMVGMQQQQQQFVIDMTNSAVLNENTHLQQQHNMATISVSSATENLQTNVLSNRSAAAATLTSSSSLTKSANSNVYNNCNKRLEILPEGPSGSCGAAAAAAVSAVPLPIATDATDTGKKQPQQQSPLTSFTNLIKGLHNNSRNVSNKSQNILHNNITPMSALALTAQHKREINNSTESFIIDQSSNSNSALSLPTTLKSKTTKTTKNMFVAAPIIIDIQDSNSGSNLIAPTQHLSALAKNLNNEATTTLAAAPPSNSSLSTTTIPFLKTKKAKKEKKRRETTQNEMVTAMSHSDASSVVVIGEEGSLSSNQQLRRVDNGRAKFQNALENHKSQRSYPGPPHMSDILSLSNSSMSSMFPAEASLSVATTAPPHRATDLNVNLHNATNPNPATLLSISDLTFAGKFNQSHNSNTSSTLVQQPDDIGCNGTDRSCTISPDSCSTTKIPPPNNKKFIPFRDRACNSNDSTSNSRTSQFAVVVDVASADQDNLQRNLFQELHTQIKQQIDKSSSHAFVPQSLALDTTLRHASATASATAMPHQHARSNVMTTNAALISEKIPKKRGRKKGSKGVDAVIAKETSLSSQMLMSSLGSGGKKVKTTKELYVEMQNRKLSNMGTIVTTASSPVLSNWASQHLQFNSQADSSCSEPSLHSPRTLDACSNNATISTMATRSTPDKYLANSRADDAGSESDTITSEPSRDSFAVQKRISDKLGICLDSNSNTQLQPPAAATNYAELRSSSALTIATIENQLRELLKLLPAVPSIKDIEAECIAELVPCTCKILEVLPTEELNKCESVEQEIDSKNVFAESQDVTCNINNNEDEKTNSAITKSIATTSNRQDANTNLVKQEQIIETTKRQKPQKSIFDLDFDDDDDPLPTLKAAAAAAAIVVKQQEFPTTGLEQTDDDDDDTTIKNLVTKQEEQQLLPVERLEMSSATPEMLLPLPIYASYTVEEDALCAAKQHYEIKTQSITQFHIKALHNCYISNVNGNWDNSDTKFSDMDGKTTSSSSAAPDVIDGYIVVPKYGALENERLNKDLVNFECTKNFKCKATTTTNDKLYDMPFLGVATGYDNSTRLQKHKINEIKVEKSAANKTVQNVALAAIKIPTGGDLETDSNNMELKDISNLLLYTDDDAYDNDEKNSNNLLTMAVDNVNMLSCANIIQSTIQQKCSTVTQIEADKSQVLSFTASMGAEDEAVEKGVKTFKIVNDKMQANAASKHSITASNIDTSSNNIATNDATKLDENNSAVTISSRRSSSCSNSSLKQTQQSINLRLRQQRLLDKQQQQLERTLADDGCIGSSSTSKKRKHNRNKKISHKQENDTESDDATLQVDEASRKPRLIKRIKIGIYGGVTSTQQISIGNNNNNSSSTDDDEIMTNYAIDCAPQSAMNIEEICAADDNIFNSSNCPTAVEDAEMYKCINDDDNHDDVTSNKYGAAVVNAAAADEIEIDDEEANYADFDDDDEEYEEEEEDYIGDFHEVVTRDISLPATGNNHIVLTIKKTPSKLNSPSNSLTAISPSLSATFSGDVANTTDTSVSVNNNALTTTATLTNTTKNLLLVDNEESNVNKQNILTNALAETLGNALSNVSDKLNTITANYKQHAEMSINLSKPSLILRELRKRKHKMPRKSKNNIEGVLKMHTFPYEATKNNNENATTSSTVEANKKLHRRLFFAHELCIRSDDGMIKDRILNLSSCSSSCTDSDESNAAADVTDQKTLLFHSKSEDGMKLQLQLNKSNNSVIQSSNDQTPSVENHTNLHNTAVEFVKTRQATSEEVEDEEVHTSLNSVAEFVTTRHVKLEEIEKAVQADSCTENMANQLCSANDNNITTNNIKNEKSSELTTTCALYETNDLPKENNGLLLSFNNIYYAPCSQSDMTSVGGDGGDNSGDTTQLKQREDVVVNKVNNDDKQLTQQQLRNEKCDDYNNMYNINNNNNNNFNLINYDNEHSLTYDSCRNSCSKPPQYYANNNNIAVTTTTTTTNAAVKTQNKSTENHLNRQTTSEQQQQQHLMEMIPYKEYRTGLRAVDEDVDDEDGNNCARIQQFKEWHQVLQLRSYDDELLTVLPYVVLD